MRFADDFYSSEYLCCSTDGMILGTAALGSFTWYVHSYELGCIYIRANAKAKATSLPICCIVSNLCVYTTAMCKRQKIKEKIRFRFRVRSNIKEP